MGRSAASAGDSMPPIDCIIDTSQPNPRVRNSSLSFPT